MNAEKTLVSKPEGKRKFGRYRFWWEDITKTGLKEIGYDYVNSFSGRLFEHANENSGSIKGWDFFTRKVILKFLGIILLDNVNILLCDFAYTIFIMSWEIGWALQQLPILKCAMLLHTAESCRFLFTYSVRVQCPELGSGVTGSSLLQLLYWKLNTTLWSKCNTKPEDALWENARDKASRHRGY